MISSLICSMCFFGLTIMQFIDDQYKWTPTSCLLAIIVILLDLKYEVELIRTKKKNWLDK